MFTFQTSTPNAMCVTPRYLHKSVLLRAVPSRIHRLVPQREKDRRQRRNFVRGPMMPMNDTADNLLRHYCDVQYVCNEKHQAIFCLFGSFPAPPMPLTLPFVETSVRACRATPTLPPSIAGRLIVGGLYAVPLPMGLPPAMGAPI